MTGNERSGYVPSGRDEIVARLRIGEITPEEAEAWARENNQPPFLSKPDAALFDPIREPYWTLAMAAAWIIWRTPNAVREHWDAYLVECKEWRFSEQIFPDGRREAGWDARRRNPVGLSDIFLKAAKSIPDDSKMRAMAEINSLWEKLKSGQIEATGVPHHAGGRDGIPIIRRYEARSAPKRIAIARWEWNDLSAIDFHVGPPDSVATATDDEAQYYEVRVWRDDVIKIWREERVESSAASSSNCRRWLIEEMKNSPDVRINTKSFFLNLAKSKFPKLSNRQFYAQWGEAISQSGASAWARPGAPKKKSNRGALKIVQGIKPGT
jgi:hypothetical protein